MNLKKYILDIPDFPQKGVMFKDITPLLNDSRAFKTAVEIMSEYAKQVGATVILAPEARGFMFGPAVSYAANIRFIPVRKPGKLPRAVISADYELEYGQNSLEMHADALKPDDKVLIVDDVLATGGTAAAMCNLVISQKATVVGLVFLIELNFLHGRETLKNYDIKALIEY